MSIINLGNQYITFDYRHPATGRDFDTLLKDGLKSGIYSGGDITITGANTISIAPFVAYINTSTDKMVRVETRTAVSLTIAESTPVLSITFTWADVAENWLDWNQRAHGSAIITNEVCLGEMIFVANAINSIDYTVKDWGKQYTSDVATGQSPIIVSSTTLVDNLNVDQVDGADLSTSTSLGTSDILIPSQKAVKTYVDDCLSVGSIIESTSLSTPTNCLYCNGASISRTTYSPLFGAITQSKGTFTITSANPGVVSLTSHGLVTGDIVSLSTTGALPSALTADTTMYYVIYADANSFQLASTWANAIAGIGIGTSAGTQSGTHSLRWIPFGFVDATNFNVPDLRGIFLRGEGSSGILSNSAAEAFNGGNSGTRKNDAMQRMTGTFYGNMTPLMEGTGTFTRGGSSEASDSYYGRSSNQWLFNTANSVSPNTARTDEAETRPASISVRRYIKYV